MTDKRRGGGEQRGAGAQRRIGTRLTVEGDVVMEDADENPRRTAQDQRRGRGEKGRQSTRAQASAEEATGQWGRATYRGYGEQSGAERAVDGKQYRATVTARSARS